MEGKKAFEGIRVYDATQGVAGPHATMLLALHGADVIKVEPLGGDWARDLGRRVGDQTVQYISFNRGKRSVAINTAHPEGRKACRRLAESCDVFIESFRPGVAARMGLSYEELRQVRPELVYMSITGFGQSGPYRDRPAVDGLIQAHSGMMMMNRTDDGRPQRQNMIMIDIVTGLYGFQAVSAALMRLFRYKEGSFIDANLMQCAAAFQASKIMEFESEGSDPPPLYTPSGIFETADTWILISAMRTTHFRSLCEVLERVDLRDDRRFADIELRRKNRAVLVAELAKEFVKRTTAEWMERLEAAGVMAEPVRDYGDWLDNHHVRSTGAYDWVSYSGFGKLPVINIPGLPPVRKDIEAAAVPGLGEHSQSILAEIGYDADQVEHLIDLGVVGQTEDKVS